MKIEGHEFKGPRTAIIPIPREDKDIIFKAQAILDFKELEALVKQVIEEEVNFWKNMNLS